MVLGFGFGNFGGATSKKRPRPTSRFMCSLVVGKLYSQCKGNLQAYVESLNSTLVVNSQAHSELLKTTTNPGVMLGLGV